MTVSACAAVNKSMMLSPRGQSGLEAKILTSASASRFWPRPGLDLVVLLCNRVFFVQKSCKSRNFVNFAINNLKSYVVNHYLVLFHNYFWPRLRPHSPGLGLEDLASFNITDVLLKFRPIVFCTCALYTVSRTLSVRRWSTPVTRPSSSQSSSFSGQISSSVRLDATQSFTRAWCKYTVPIRQKSLTCGPNSRVCSA